MKIYCPKCNFEPTPRHRWACRPGCGHIWNTFATQGICPKCKKMWRETNCPRCKMWSLHNDWYHDDTPEHEKEIEEVFGAN